MEAVRQVIRRRRTRKARLQVARQTPPNPRIVRTAAALVKRMSRCRTGKLVKAVKTKWTIKMSSKRSLEKRRKSRRWMLRTMLLLLEGSDVKLNLIWWMTISTLHHRNRMSPSHSSSSSCANADRQSKRPRNSRNRSKRLRNRSKRARLRPIWTFLSFRSLTTMKSITRSTKWRWESENSPKIRLRQLCKRLNVLVTRVLQKRKNRFKLGQWTLKN